MIQEKKRVLGRGLESLIPTARTFAPAVPVAAVAAPVTGVAVPESAIDLAPGERVQEIRLEEIEPSPYQPRRRQDEAALEELTQSIRAQGVLQPIVIRYISAGAAQPAAAGAGGNGENPHPISPSPGEIRVGQPINALGGEEAHAGARVPQWQVRYQLIAGERRWLASRRAGRATVP